MSDRVALLAAFVRSRRDVVHVWGLNDCVLFCADWARVLTGADYATGLRGAYATALGAARTLQRLGHDHVGALIDAKLGPPLARPAMAARGDVALIDGPFGETAGVVVGAVVVAPGLSGLASVSLARAERAWRLG